MKELSLNVLDITENSIKANADCISILIEERDSLLTLTIEDNGCGMDEETVKAVTDPFYTTRTTRKVGMGIPLLKMEAEQTGGTFSLVSKPQLQFPDSHGTVVTAQFHTDHIDCIPLGDMISTMTTLIQGSPNVDFRFTHTWDGGQAELDTAQMRAVLGEDVPLNCYEVIQWIAESLREQYGNHDR